VIICINPECQKRQNSDSSEFCQFCGTPLLIQGRYRLLQPLRPLDRRLSTEVFEIDDIGVRKVMKILNSDRSDEIEHLEREVCLLQEMNHPGIPKADLDGYFTVSLPNCSRSLHCLVMEKIEGVNLEKWVEIYGKISQKQALDWLRQLLGILDELHREGFFHRDIKPSNIMCKPDGQLVLIDFGSVREITVTYLVKLKRSPNLTTKIKEITTIFSRGYTPQEQINGKALPQSDFFALGRTFVYLLTGKHPAELPTNSQTGKLVWHDLAPQVSPLLAEFIDEWMAQLPRNRPQDSDAILQNLTPNRLLWKRIQRFLKSPHFKIIVASLLFLAVTYRLSFPWKAQYYYDRGLAAHRANHLDLARRNYEKALKFNDKDSRIYNNIGRICQELDDTGCAEKNYQTSLDLDPENSVANYNLGDLYEDKGQLDRAAAEYEKAIASGGPVAANAISSLARIRILQGNATTAIELSRQGLRQANKNRLKSTLYRNLGWAYLTQADYRQAEENLQKALRLQPKRTDAYCLFAQVREAQNRQNEALQFWKDCRDGDAEDRVEIPVWQTTARQRLEEAGTKP
jgi:serine/threonine protein kinase